MNCPTTPLSQVRSGEAAAPDIAIGWTDDAEGRLTSEVYDYGNDDANTGGKTADDYTDTYGYDLNGNRITKSHDQSNDGTIDLTITDSYDQENRLTGETDSAGDNTVYNYDNNGSPPARLFFPFSANARQHEWEVRGMATPTTYLLTTPFTDGDGSPTLAIGNSPLRWSRRFL